MICWLVLNMLPLHFKAECKILYLGQGNPTHKYRLGKEWLESSRGEEDLGVLVDKKLSVTKQCHLQPRGTKAS